MPVIDITNKKVVVTKGAIRVRTAPKRCSGWPYLAWMLRYDSEYDRPGILFLSHEKGEILDILPGSEYTVEDI